MLKGKKISAIIPAHNEEEYIENTLEGLTYPWLDEVIVVNDASTDDTAKIVTNYPVKLVCLMEQMGKGQALNEGIKVSTGDVLLFLDADLGLSSKKLDALVYPVIEERAEVTIAVIPIKGGGLGVVRKVAHLGIKFITGNTMEAPLSGQRAIKRDILTIITPFQRGYGLEIGMDIDIIRNGVSFQEIPCKIKHRVTGKDIKGFKHRAKQLKDIFKTLWLKRRI